MILLIIYFILMLVFLAVAVFFVFIFASSAYGLIAGLGKPNAPYVPLPEGALVEALKYISIDEKSVVYDLGSGDGRVVAALYRQHRRGRFVGIEREPWPHLLAKIKTRDIVEPNFKLIRGDIFKKDLSEANIVTTYLFPKVMDALLPKLTKELAPGSKLYSIDFTFSNKNPEQVIDLGRVKGQLGRKLFVYQF